MKDQFSEAERVEIYNAFKLYLSCKASLRHTEKEIAEHLMNKYPNSVLYFSIIGLNFFALDMGDKLKEALINGK